MSSVQIEPRENYRCEKEECIKWFLWHLICKMISVFENDMVGVKSLLNVQYTLVPHC